VLLDFARDAARSTLRLLGGAEHEVEEHTPAEAPLKEAIAALHHAAESMDRHVEVMEGVAATLPELTGALVKLTEQLGEMLHLAAPLEAAEREVAGLGHLFRRRHHAGAASAAATGRDDRPLVRDGEGKGAGEAPAAEAVAAPAAGAVAQPAEGAVASSDGAGAGNGSTSGAPAGS
jgi:hypothetical protein